MGSPWVLFMSSTDSKLEEKKSRQIIKSQENNTTGENCATFFGVKL